MKSLLRIFTVILVTAFLFNMSIQAQTPNPQLKIKEQKSKRNPLIYLKQQQWGKYPGGGIGITSNPYWANVNAPHTYNSSVNQLFTPTVNAIWGKVNYDSVSYDPNSYIRSADGGVTWRVDSVDAPAGYGLSGIAPVDATTCYAALYNANVGIGGGIFKTADGGRSWKQVNAGSLFSVNSFPDIVYFFDAQHGLAVGDDDGVDTARLEIYTTADAGKTWQRVPDRNNPPTAHYAFSTNFNGYTVAQNRFWFTASDSYGNSYIYRSDDFGQHWQQFLYTLPTPIYDFAFTDKLNGLGVSLNFGVGASVVETHDGGKTWADKNVTGYPMGLFLTVIPSTHTYVSTMPYYAAPVAGSSYSNDYGATWNLIDSGTNFNHFAVSFFNPLTGWSGRAESVDPKGGMFKWKYQTLLDDAVTVLANETPDVSENSTTKLSVYPNPASSSVNISFSLPSTQKAAVTIYDVNGNLIKILASGQLQEGPHQLQWNPGSAVAGNYFLKLQTINKIETKKIILMR
jgi:photosystem II stability/assembly factor-like uncharacterized protein